MELRETNTADLEQEWAFVRDMPEDENGLTNSWHGVSRETFAEKVLPQIMAWSRGEGLPEGYVPETQYYLWDEGRIVGQFRIRHYLCESLRAGAGHIGYFIAKPYRNRGYGTLGLRLTLEKARKIIPEDEIWLRVNRDNPASLRVMLNNGGRVVSEDEAHYFVRIPKDAGRAAVRPADPRDLPDAAVLACVLQPDSRPVNMAAELSDLP